MIRTALLLCAGLLAALGFACVPQRPIVVSTVVDCSSPSNFANSVKMLSADFVPAPMDPLSTPNSNVPINNQKILEDLANAFKLAPDRLRTQLCGGGGNPG